MHCGRLPKVIISDRDAALMKSLDTVFPLARKMLCSWHIIEQNLQTNVSKYFSSKKDFEGFKDLVIDLKDSKKLIDIDDNLRKMQEYCKKHCKLVKNVKKPDAEAIHGSELAMNYIDGLIEIKEKWIKCYVDKYPHMGCYTISRVESQHFALKGKIKAASSIETAFHHINNTINDQCSRYSRYSGRDKLARDPHSKYTFLFKDLINEVKFAVSLIYTSSLKTLS